MTLHWCWIQLQNLEQNLSLVVFVWLVMKAKAIIFFPEWRMAFMLPASSSFDFVERKVYENNVWKYMEGPEVSRFYTFCTGGSSIKMTGLQWRLPKQEWGMLVYCWNVIINWVVTNPHSQFPVEVGELESEAELGPLSDKELLNWRCCFLSTINGGRHTKDRGF